MQAERKSVKKETVKNVIPVFEQRQKDKSTHAAIILKYEILFLKHYI